MALDLQPHRLSTAEYERMVDAGALADMDVELLDGLLVDMSPESEIHWSVTNRLMVLNRATNGHGSRQRTAPCR